MGPRIVSLLPSATEIVCALGLSDALVGVSHECDFPAGIESLPHCSGVKRPLGEGSAAIDATVRAILSEALSVYRVDVDLLKALKPDFVVTQAQCEVCAVSEDDLATALAGWTGGRPEILSLSPMRLADAFADIERVGAALGRAGEAARCIERLSARMDAIARKAACLPPRRVALIDWLAPLMMGAEWMPELVELAGGAPLLAEPGQHTHAIPFAALAKAAPEIIIVAPCGFSIPQSLADMPALTGRPGWGDLPAMRKGEVYVADGNHYFNRPGPRLVESLEIVAEILNPAMFDFGHRGKAYLPWPPAECHEESRA
jgi:iron complex transport system substrate-binding protein